MNWKRAGRYLKVRLMDIFAFELARIPADSIVRFTMSAPEKKSDWRKITGTRLADGSFQVEKLTEKQAFHCKIAAGAELFKDEIFHLFASEMKQLELRSNEYSYSFRAAKKRVLFNKSKLKNPVKECAKTQDREKNYILKEGMNIPPLIDLGIFYNDCTLIKRSSAKFKQINRFVEFADDLLKNTECPEDRDFTIVDFGCGKSYLTFILYYYFTEIKKWRVKMVGMDLKKDVIEHCRLVAEKYKYDNLTFECGDIGDYCRDEKIDMIVTLHACDTATDYALYHAVRKDVRFILSVPCCQHELNSQFDGKNLSVLGDYGIVKERVSALLTDTIRAELLKYCNYNVQIMEFVDMCHTPKNLLLRCEKRINSSLDGREQHIANVKKMMDEFSLSPTLYRLLCNPPQDERI